MDGCLLPTNTAHVCSTAYSPYLQAPVRAWCPIWQVSVFQLTLRLCREFDDRKHWMQLSVMVGFLKQLFCLLDQMVRFGDAETVRFRWDVT